MVGKLLSQNKEYGRRKCEQITLGKKMGKIYNNPIDKNVLFLQFT